MMTSSAPKDAKFLDVEPVEAIQVSYLSNLTMRVRMSVALFEKLSEPKEFIDGLISEIDELYGYADDQVDAMRVLRDAIVQSLHHIPESEKRHKEPEMGVSVDAVCDSCGSERAPKGRFPNYVCSDCGESQGKVCDSQPNWLVQY